MIKILYKNLCIIFRQSHYYRQIDLNETGKEPQFSIFTFLNFFILLIACSLCLILNNPNDKVLDGILTFASIFATLIIPVIILVYDKFRTDELSGLSEIRKRSSGAQKQRKILLNFTGRFIFNSLETVIIAVTLVMLILLKNSGCVDIVSLSIYDYKWQSSISIEGVEIFFTLIWSYILKIIFYMILLKFLLFVFYTISSLGDFFKDVLTEQKSGLQ